MITSLFRIFRFFNSHDSRSDDIYFVIPISGPLIIYFVILISGRLKPETESGQCESVMKLIR